MPAKPFAAIVTVGTELVTGQRLDTNGAEIASALLVAGFAVVEMLSVADDAARLALHLKRLTDECAVVIVTGGLGPTHDDITRDAASHALRKPLLRDASIECALAGIISRHRHPDAAEQVLTQADIIEGATVIAPTTGTAPGQIIPTATGYLVLLPGPPSEMRPMLADFLNAHGSATPPVRLRSSGVSESDAQLAAQRVLGDRADVGLTVLAAPADVEVVLFDEGAGATELTRLGELVREALGDACYSSDGSSMAETVIRLARERGVRIACAESCTGGKIAAALTDVPGSSEVFLGGVVSYSNEMKVASLGVMKGSIAQHGAVSEEVARAMAIGAAGVTGSAFAVSTTGIAGPTGGTPEKPVGLVWFGIRTPSGVMCERREFFGDRDGVRTRATMYALNLLRQALLDDK
ncbi:MAG: competence/damage-inducible protein A [Actinobacteria bacterium HGW-Actinobacteria-6]|jgi:nicotinamide-nucleotide amidase|nr:MAG: competence/damage-inducible protein A [Actinobacteria bacterium HGW-Actinobacteria-6]